MKTVSAREEEIHTLRAKLASRKKRVAKEKGRERKWLAGRGRRVIENSRLRTIQTDPLSRDAVKTISAKLKPFNQTGEKLKGFLPG